jgi:hypothetical protein
VDMQEHFYSDDPRDGHPDVRTRLAGVDYFFVGNGHVLAAIQVCRSGEGTPLGLLVMDPGEFGPKRAALTCDPEDGLAHTRVTVKTGTRVYTPSHSEIRASWDEIDDIPAVRVSWTAGSLHVEETFYCPDRRRPRLYRRIALASNESQITRSSLLTRCAKPSETYTLDVSREITESALLVYDVIPTREGYAVESSWERAGVQIHHSASFWGGLTQCTTGDRELDHLFKAARRQLPVVVDENGRMDGSIWQYNLEWVRDQAHVAEALVRLGDCGRARKMLLRLLDDFVSPDGDTVDSGKLRPTTEIELDQNGELLTALRTYVDWTGDIELVASRWPTVRRLAEFPLRGGFLHQPSGLLHNRREYWERHEGHGIEDGFELMHQFFLSWGLSSAAYLARLCREDGDRKDWALASAALRSSMLDDARYRMVENGYLIKRRSIDGVWQRTIEAPAGCPLPDGIPLKNPGPHYLDPDASSVLPIAYGYIEPHGELARNTLAHVERLWNQEWDGGGYGRYNATSEADSAGPWPFASLFVARAYVEAGNDGKVWRVLRWLARKPGGLAGAWFEFDGPRMAPPYPQVGIPPWTWAELVTLFVHHLLGVYPSHSGIMIRPHLLQGLEQMRASLLVRGHRLELLVRRARTNTERGARSGARQLPSQNGGIRLTPMESDTSVEVVC